MTIIELKQKYMDQYDKAESLFRCLDKITDILIDARHGKMGKDYAINELSVLVDEDYSNRELVLKVIKELKEVEE